MYRKKGFYRKLILFLAFIAVFTCFSLAQTFEAVKNQVKVHTLENGMKFIVLERHDAPVVSFHVYADVGSANESYGITGISHLLEHMAFKGSKVLGTTDYEAEIKVLEELDALYDEIKKEKAKAKPDAEKIKKRMRKNRRPEFSNIKLLRKKTGEVVNVIKGKTGETKDVVGGARKEARLWKKQENIRKGYLAGRYGAIPFLDDLPGWGADHG